MCFKDISQLTFVVGDDKLPQEKFLISFFETVNAKIINSIDIYSYSRINEFYELFKTKFVDFCVNEFDLDISIYLERGFRSTFRPTVRTRENLTLLNIAFSLFNAIELTSTSNVVFLLENPENNLSSTNQGRIATTLLKYKSKKLKIIVTTNSSIIIETIGHLIEVFKLNYYKHINVLIFQPDKEIKESHFGKDGVLINWEYGLFLPEYDFFDGDNCNQGKYKWTKNKRQMVSSESKKVQKDEKN